MIPLLITATILALLLAAWLAWRNFLASRHVRRSAARGYAGEVAAAKHLQAAGFVIIERHPRGQYTWWLYGVAQTAQMQADYRVRRDDKDYLVEVKTGRSSRPNRAQTRRQILEYSVYYQDIKGIIFVNGDTGSIHEIQFPPPSKPALSRQSQPFGCLFFALILGGVLGWLLAHIR